MVVMITSEEYKELVIKANKYDESQKPKMCSAENKTEDKIEEIKIKKVTPEEMGKIMDELKNKIIGGK
ncbi:MAG: hypothetical protein V8R81_01255 [Clostridia bacterium]